MNEFMKDLGESLPTNSIFYNSLVYIFLSNPTPQQNFESLARNGASKVFLTVVIRKTTLDSTK